MPEWYGSLLIQSRNQVPPRQLSLLHQLCRPHPHGAQRHHLRQPARPPPPLCLPRLRAPPPNLPVHPLPALLTPGLRTAALHPQHRLEPRRHRLRDQALPAARHPRNIHGVQLRLRRRRPKRPLRFRRRVCRGARGRYEQGEEGDLLGGAERDAAGGVAGRADGACVAEASLSGTYAPNIGGRGRQALLTRSRP